MKKSNEIIVYCKNENNKSIIADELKKFECVENDLSDTARLSSLVSIVQPTLTIIVDDYATYKNDQWINYFKEFKEQHNDSGGHLLFVSKNDDKNFVDALLKAGVDDFITDPLDPYVLGIKIHHLVKVEDNSIIYTVVPEPHSKCLLSVKLNLKSIHENGITANAEFLFAKNVFANIDCALLNVIYGKKLKLKSTNSEKLSDGTYDIFFEFDQDDQEVIIKTRAFIAKKIMLNEQESLTTDSASKSSKKVLITFADVIDHAISIEETGAKLYSKLGEISRDTTLKTLFHKLQNEELGHKETYKKIKDNYLNEVQNMSQDRKNIVQNSSAKTIDLADKIKDKIFNRLEVIKQFQTIDNSPNMFNVIIDIESKTIEFFTNLKNFLPTKEAHYIDAIINEEKRHATVLIKTRNAKKGHAIKI